MLVPTIVGGACLITGGLHFITRKERDIVKRWDNIMEASGVKNTFGETFVITKITKKKNRFFLKVRTPDALEYKDLTKMKKSIEDSMPCRLEFGNPNMSKYIYCTLINKLNETEEEKLIDRWQEVMEGLGLKNKEDKYFSIKKIQTKDYGYDCDILTPEGKEFDDIMINKKKIEESFPCRLVMKKSYMSKYIECKIITKKMDTKEEEMLLRWEEVMEGLGLKNKVNKYFSIDKITEDSYGYLCDVEIPEGLEYEQLQEASIKIQDSFPCKLELKKEPLSNKIETKLILKEFKMVPFNPPKTKPFQIFVGIGYDGKPVLIDMNKFPHVLDTGVTGAGKSKLIDHIVTTLIHNHTKEEMELFIIQMDKPDTIIYEDCAQVSYYADDLEKAENMVNYILNELKRSDNLIKPLRKKGHEANIEAFNELYPEKALTYKYLIIEEYASLAEGDGDTAEIKQRKNKIKAAIERIAQVGRSSGCFIIVGIQRPTADSLPSFVKAMANTKISFRQMNKISSRVALDNDMAVGLSLYEAVLCTNETKYIKTQYITSEDIMRYIKNSIEKDHKFIDLGIVDDTSKKGNSKKEQIKDKYKDEFSKLEQRVKSPYYIENYTPKESTVQENVIPIGQMERKRKFQNGRINMPNKDTKK